MWCVQFDEVGPPEVLRLVELPDPEPGRGQARVRVRASGVQPWDVKQRRGLAPAALPHRPGTELAGVVEAVGPGVSGIAAGAEVIGFGVAGAHATHALVRADRLVARPPELDWPAAGALSESGQTAALALAAVRVAAGETVLVHAAAGGVGVMAVQLAAVRGARVVGTASPGNHEFLRALGATPVAYGPGLVERVRELGPVHAAVDAAGGPALAASLALVADPRRVVTLVDYPAAAAAGAQGLAGERSAGRLAELVDLCRSGRLRVAVAATYPLAEAAGAHARVEAGHVRGKVVLVSEW